MASIWRRAMVYLGLVDDEEYDEYEPYPPEPAPQPKPVRRAPMSERSYEPEPQPSAPSGMTGMSGVRTLQDVSKRVVWPGRESRVVGAWLDRLVEVGVPTRPNLDDQSVQVAPLSIGNQLVDLARRLDDPHDVAGQRVREEPFRIRW